MTTGQIASESKHHGYGTPGIIGTVRALLERKASLNAILPLAGTRLTGLSARVRVDILSCRNLFEPVGRQRQRLHGVHGLNWCECTLTSASSSAHEGS